MGGGALRIAAGPTKKRRKGPSICRRKDPIKWQNSQKPRFRYFSVPATSRILTGNFLLPKDFHRLVFRERRLGALPLQIDIVPVFWARKHDSVRFTHARMITLPISPDHHRNHEHPKSLPSGASIRSLSSFVSVSSDPVPFWLPRPASALPRNPSGIRSGCSLR